MSNSAKSLQYFSYYLLLTGINLLFAPNLLLTTFGMPPTKEVWIRVVGMIVLLLFVYYMAASKSESPLIFKASVFTRSSVILFFAVFVMMGLATPSLLFFGGVDLAGAIWTYAAMKKEGKW
jgi:uncharacterized membrane-anchored protein